MKTQMKEIARRVSQSKAAKALAGSVALVAAAPSYAVTTFTVLPTAAATAVDSLIGLGADVGTILFGIGLPVLLAVIGWNVLRGGAKKGARL